MGILLSRINFYHKFNFRECKNLAEFVPFGQFGPVSTN
jgi:hypothetical protein